MDKRIVRIWSAGDQLPATNILSQRLEKEYQRANDEEHTLENIQTDTAEFVYVWVVNLGEKPDLRRSHRIVIWQEQLKFEDTSCTNVRLFRVCIRPYQITRLHMETERVHGLRRRNILDCPRVELHLYLAHFLQRYQHSTQLGAFCECLRLCHQPLCLLYDPLW